MRMALEQAAAAAELGEVPVGALVVRDGEVIARAHNRVETAHSSSAHAEMLALAAAEEALHAKWLTGCTMYVTLEPCPMCAGAVMLSRVRRLVFGAPDPAQGCAGSVYRIPEDPAFNHFCETEGGVLRDECASLLHTFFADMRQN
ncbi:MAG: nucleoside deaminase [Oscillospiraceae bacterium]|nr:nucleoside deaminase [Oscillospiraceae bacterium]